MKIEIPELSLVVLIGPSSAGKSTFAAKYFKSTEIISSDFCRSIVSDDVNSLEASADAFDLVHYIISKRLKRGNLTVVDATNLQEEARKSLLKLAKQYHTFPVAIVLNLPEKLCQERNKVRTDRAINSSVIRNQHRQMRRSIRRLKKEGFRFIFTLKNEEEVEQTKISRLKLKPNKKEENGPFDIIGDIHGCFTELRNLLTKLGYKVTKHRNREQNYGYSVIAPSARKALFLGDLTDRGPASNEVLRLVMSMVKNGTAHCISGNHDAKLLKKLNGKNVQLTHGLAETMEQLNNEPSTFIEEVRQFLEGLISHYVLDHGKLVVAHAGLRAEMQGRGSGAVRSFCLYGETTGEIDEFGLPVRYNWAKDYRGKAMVVYGHTPVPDAEWLNRTIDIDTGCVFGGKLTALRYPELELVEVKALKVHAEPKRPLQPSVQNGLSAQQEQDDMLHIEDVIGKRIISTRLRPNITIREHNSIAALEVMSRFAINPKWLAYLPPTMSPSACSSLEGYLEYPTEAFDYYLENGVSRIICEEKHMGSRAVVVIGKDLEAIRSRFGVEKEGIGVVYTRTGRSFFNDKDLEQKLLLRLQAALTSNGFWQKFDTNWAIFDCELMPWSAKAQALLQGQYAAVGSSANAALPIVMEALQQAGSRGLDLNGHLEKTGARIEMAKKFRSAYRNYCWPVNTLDDYKLAPFHIMATEGQVHVDKNHLWHMDQIHQICQEDPKVLLATNYLEVDLNNKAAVQEALHWWGDITSKGGEGMVVKPLNFISTGPKGLLQPAIKCRGKEYLRIIYGPEYTSPENLKILKKRGLSTKRSLAIRELALGIEALERFVKRAPLRATHECVFGVLALESEAVDPTL